MFSRGLKSWGDSDWLASRVDKWVAQCHGYTKLRSRRLSRGCQTMLDRPSPFWSRSDSEVLNEIPLTGSNGEINTNVNLSSLSLDDTINNGNEPEEVDTMSFCEKGFQYDQDIADYIAYLNKPIINMNDHFIEIHQYHYEPRHILGGMIPEDVPFRPPTRRKKHKINLKTTEIVDNTGLSSVMKSPEYSQFLVKRGSENQPLRLVSGRSSGEENKTPRELDLHRPLSQPSKSLTPEPRVDTVVSKEGDVKVKRVQTDVQTFSTSVDLRRVEPPRSFLSFRSSKKNKSGRRNKKVVVGEEGIVGPIWPAVLLTFDRSISPGTSPEPPTESEV